MEAEYESGRTPSALPVYVHGAYHDQGYENAEEAVAEFGQLIDEGRLAEAGQSQWT